jgi:diacylglycerol O-acyltransferase/trehalose O-mycolyltransferase
MDVELRDEHLDRRRFLHVASATGVAVAAGAMLPDDASAISGNRRRPDLIGVEADDGSRVIAQHVLDSRAVDITIDSAALGQTAGARVLLPRRFSSRSREAWPVFYLLHGGLGSYVDWTESSDIERLTRATDVLVVMPDGGRLGFYADWWNHGAGNKPGWETFHLTELRQILERGLGAGDLRAIAGLSMGGFGAMSYAGRHPEMFTAAAAFSGVLDTTHPTVAPIFPGPYPTWLMQTFLQPLGYDALALFGDPTAQADIWAAHNPADLVENLRGMALFVSCGNGQLGALDPPGSDPSSLLAQLEAALLLHNQEFVDRARTLGIDVTVDFYGPGTHTWPYWRRALQVAFPQLMRAIGAV